MRIKRATIEDAAEILTLQKLAYLSEAVIYNDYSIPPLTQSIAQIEAEFDEQLFFKVSVEGGRIIGSVRGYLRERTCYVGKLIVHPEFWNRGIGTALISKIERHFEQAQRYELFTGYLSERNVYLYRKLGYRAFRREKLSSSLQLVYMEKRNDTGEKQ